MINERSDHGESRSLTSLRGRGEEADLDLFLAKFIGKFVDGGPGTRTDGLAVDIKIIDKMDLATLIDGDLIAGTDAETGVVVGAVVHETFARSGVGLLVEGAGNRQLGTYTCLEVVTM